MSTNDNPFENEFSDESRPLNDNTKKVEFAKFTEPIPEVEKTETTDTFHTYYYTRNVTTSEIYSFTKSALLNNESENKSLLNYLTERGKFLIKCNEGSVDLETPSEVVDQKDVGGYFTIWTCLGISLLHLITKTFEFKQENIINTTFLLLFISVGLESITLVYAHKLKIFQDIIQFKFGILNLSYLIFKFISEILSIGLGNFLSCLLLILSQGIFTILINFRVWDTMDRRKWAENRIQMASILVIEIVVYSSIAILDTVL